MFCGRYLSGTGLVLVTAILLAACGQETEEDPRAGLRAPEGPVPAEPQRPGDPAGGYDALVNKAYVTCGIPYSAYKKTASSPPPPTHLLPGRKGRNAELPYQFTSMVSKEGVELITNNCLICHASFFNGKLIVGLGNESLDFTIDRSAFAEGVGTEVKGGAEAAEWRKWADRIAAIAPYSTTDTVGVNPAVNLTWTLFMHRDPKTLAWSQKPLMEPPPKKPLPASVPPWWRMKKKHAMFYSAGGRGDHARLMILASTLCTDTVEEAKEIDAYAPDIRAFIASLEPPAYPFDIDQHIADRGRGVFERNCSSCHGTYGKDWTYPNLVIGVEQVGTDPALALGGGGVSEGEERFLRWFKDSFYGEKSRLVVTPGYIAPPLDGVWATAPYLHNGSVPTIEVLLNSPKRPEYWLRSFESTDYNPQTLGWNYTELSYGKGGSKDPNERKRIYDTTLPGYSNQGHTFGDALTGDERKAVLEYLKTL